MDKFKKELEELLNSHSIEMSVICLIFYSLK